MSKLSFRARQLDSFKSMPVFRSEEIPDVSDIADIKRAVLQMPTGMEREEETEHHLQRALSAQQVYGTAEALVIPVPEIDNVSDEYDKIYGTQYRLPKQYIHAQALGVEQEIPDYDMDSEDESWLNVQSEKMEITPYQFEEMIDRLEKGSGQQVTTIQEAKLLLKQDDDLIITVYDYWLNKRLRQKSLALIPSVKTEKRDGSCTNNPYVAFRRRTEKMQTRKNRKNDEVSYEKMVKLQRDLKKAQSILNLIARREKYKKQLLNSTVEILEKRYDMEDFTGTQVAYAESQKTQRPVFYPLYDQYNNHRNKLDSEQPARPRKKYKKRQKHQSGLSGTSGAVEMVDVDIYANSAGSSADSADDAEEDADGPFAFRRRQDCNYHAPLETEGCRLAGGDWPWTASRRGSKHYRYNVSSISTGPETRRCIGFARRRIGRGGRIVLDRAHTEQSAHFWDRLLDAELPEPTKSSQAEMKSPKQENEESTTFQQLIEQEKWLHFAPCEEYDQTDALFNGALASLNDVPDLEVEAEIQTTVMPSPPVVSSNQIASLYSQSHTPNQSKHSALIKERLIEVVNSTPRTHTETEQSFEKQKNHINSQIQKPVVPARTSLLSSSLGGTPSIKSRLDPRHVGSALQALVNGENGRVHSSNSAPKRNDTNPAPKHSEGLTNGVHLARPNTETFHHHKKLTLPLTPSSENNDHQHEAHYSNGPVPAYINDVATTMEVS